MKPRWRKVICSCSSRTAYWHQGCPAGSGQPPFSHQMRSRTPPAEDPWQQPVHACLDMTCALSQCWHLCCHAACVKLQGHGKNLMTRLVKLTVESSCEQNYCREEQCQRLGQPVFVLTLPGFAGVHAIADVRCADCMCKLELANTACCVQSAGGVSQLSGRQLADNVCTSHHIGILLVQGPASGITCMSCAESCRSTADASAGSKAPYRR